QPEITNLQSEISAGLLVGLHVPPGLHRRAEGLVVLLRLVLEGDGTEVHREVVGGTVLAGPGVVRRNDAVLHRDRLELLLLSGTLLADVQHSLFDRLAGRHREHQVRARGAHRSGELDIVEGYLAGARPAADRAGTGVHAPEAVRAHLDRVRVLVVGAL